MKGWNDEGLDVVLTEGSLSECLTYCTSRLMRCPRPSIIYSSAQLSSLLVSHSIITWAAGEESQQFDRSRAEALAQAAPNTKHGIGSSHLVGGFSCKRLSYESLYSRPGKIQSTIAGMYSFLYIFSAEKKAIEFVLLCNF